MNLPPEELARFDEEGYLFFPNRFSAEEVRVLKAAAKEVFALDREEIWRESSGVARTAFAAHTYNEAFRRLGRHPRLLEPVQQTLEGPVYMHQYKVNAKVAFDGDVWQWHQDFGTWRRDDDMPRATGHEHRRFSRRRDGGQRTPAFSTGQPQARRDRGRS